MKQRWTELLNPMTFRERSPRLSFDGRNPFENDYGRLISSSSIRRLQDKTQVIPLEKSDFIRTRLTHSLEVSYIASGIGLSIEEFLLKNKYLELEYKGHLSSLLRVAGLVHDLGNPPFGHFGEEAVQQFFSQFFKNNPDINLSDREKADFLYFDGNVQTFRILRRLHHFGDDFSFNLTYPSLASIIKYPLNSLDGNKGKGTEVWKKKFGYFASEQQSFVDINHLLGLNNLRHPVVYLLEAADDIAFCAADIEDGVNLGILTYEDILSVFKGNLKQNDNLIGVLEELYDKIKVQGNDKVNLVIQKFRIICQGKMIEAVIDSFIHNYISIMSGNYPYEIIDMSAAADIRKSFKKLQYIIFDNKKIMQAELAGWEAITGLLEIFVQGILSPDFKPGNSNRESRLYKNLSSSYRHIYERYSKKYYGNDTYNKIQLVVDFVVGMTDSYAINLYQKLKGVNLK
jgi:dGTPase